MLKDDEYLKSLLNNYYEVQLKKLDLVHDFNEGHQSLDQIDDKISNQRKDLIIYINNLINAIKSQILNEEKEIEYYKALVKEIPLSQRDMSSIQRKLDINQKLYEFFVRKKSFYIYF